MVGPAAQSSTSLFREGGRVLGPDFDSLAGDASGYSILGMSWVEAGVAGPPGAQGTPAEEHSPST